MSDVESLRVALARAASAGPSAFLDDEVRQHLEALLAAYVEQRHCKTGSDSAITLANPPQQTRDGAWPDQTLQPGGQAGPYKLLQRIGEGGMGTVYLAEQERPIRRRVALKVIKPGMDSARVIARFEAERQALAMMDHPNIARVLDAGATESGQPYFVMELVQGVRITQYCDENRLSLRERLELFLAVCQAIQHAHQKGIIHRDIKPSNVLVALYEGRPAPKVIDFGVAKATEQRLTEHTLCTLQGTAVGTPEYMSPEQAEASALGVDTRSDIYSLGVLLYELLTGTTPWERERVRSLGFSEFVRLLNEEQPPKPSKRLSASERPAAVAAQRNAAPTELAKLVRGDLDWIVMKCLEKDRTRRYDAASALARDLERYLSDEPVEARPPSAGYRFGKFARKHKRSLAFAATLAALVAVGTTTSVWQAMRATIAERHALGERDKALAAEQSEREARGRAEAAEVQAKTARDRAVTAERKAERDRDLAVSAQASALEAAKQAKLDAATAKAVTDFLRHDLLGRADPTKEPDRGLKLRDVLDRAAKSIGGRFPSQPLVEAAIRETIGGAYRSLGIYEEAAGQLSAAEALRRRESGSEDPMTLADKADLALVYCEQGRPAEAERLYAEVLAISRKTLGAKHKFTLSTLAKLGVAYSEQGKYADAKRVYNEALHAGRLVLDKRNPVLHEIVNNLGSLLLESHDYQAAEPLLVEGLDLHKQVLGEKHPDTITSMNNLAIAYEGLGRPSEAEPLLTRALELRRSVQGDEHPLTITAMSSLALLYLNQGKNEEAERLLAAALNLRLKVQGEKNPLTITAMNNLALAYSRQRRFDEAEPLYAKALELRIRVQGKDHPLSQVAQFNLAVAYQQRQRFADAEPLLEALLAIRRRQSGALQPQLVDVLARLGVNRLRQHRYSDAETLLREYLALLEQNEAQGWRRWDAEGAVGEALAGQGNHAEAEPLLLSSYEGLRSYAEKHPEADQGLARGAVRRLVDNYDAWGKQDAASMWRKRLEP